jgi:hypothetical protein
MNLGDYLTLHLRHTTWGEYANYYTTDEPTIYHTWGEHANYYTTDEPTIYHTWGGHANYPQVW